MVSRDFCFRYFDAGMPQAYEAVLDIANSEESEYTCVNTLLLLLLMLLLLLLLLLRLLLPIQILHATQYLKVTRLSDTGTARPTARTSSIFWEFIAFTLRPL